MSKVTFLKSTSQSSMILGQSQLRPQDGNVKKKVAGVMLTSLVDAFSILVIYLLFGPSITGEAVPPEMGVQLPIAIQSELTDQETNLVIKGDHYYLQNHEVSKNQLLPALKKISAQMKERKKALVIISDKKNDIEQLNPVLIAASEAGLSQLRLAVEHQGE